MDEYIFDNILMKLDECSSKRKCLFCADCIAFALLACRDLQTLRNEEPIAISGNPFIKFLCSTLPGKTRGRRFNPCSHNEFTWYEAFLLSWTLLKLTPEKRDACRKKLPCHQEFKTLKSLSKYA